jgi:Protein of unknown function (DUF3822)
VDSGTNDQLIENMARAMMPREILAQASSMHLCMHIHPMWVCATVADAAGGQIVWTQAFQVTTPSADSFDLAIAFVSEKNWGDKVFRKCTISFDTGDFALVPSAFFQKQNELTLLQFQTGKQHLQAASLSLNELSAELIFEVDTPLQALTHKFPNARIFPSAFLLARFAHSQSAKEQNALHILFHQPYLTLAIVKNKELLLLNNYMAQSAEDVLYYTANAAMQLGVDLEHAQLKLYMPAANAELLELLKDYNTATEIAVSEGTVDQPIITYMHLVCV